MPGGPPALGTPSSERSPPPRQWYLELVLSARQAEVSHLSHRSSTQHLNWDLAISGFDGPLSKGLRTSFLPYHWA